MTIRRLVLSALIGLALLAVPSQARAEAYIAPFLGLNFGGDAGCQELTDCNDKNLTYGVALGARNVLLGFEEEFAYTSDFFGDDLTQSTAVVTLMSNLVVGPQLGFFRPYGVIGLGLVRTNVDIGLSDETTSDNSLGWDVGGGIELSSRHVGVRGDVRYFHGFQVLDVPFLESLGGVKLDYGRASAALVLRF